MRTAFNTGEADGKARPAFACGGSPGCASSLQLLQEEFARHESVVRNLLQLSQVCEEDRNIAFTFTEVVTQNNSSSVEGEVMDTSGSMDDSSPSRQASPGKERKVSFSLSEEILPMLDLSAAQDLNGDLSPSSSQHQQRTISPDYGRDSPRSGVFPSINTDISEGSSPMMNSFVVPNANEVLHACRRSRTPEFLATDLEDHTARSRLRDVLRSKGCEHAVAWLIVLNVATYGIDADYSVKHPTSNPPALMRLADVFFAIAFLIELVLRIVAYGKSFASLSNPEIRWNALDTLIVLLAVVEELITYSIAGAPDVSAIRMLRLLRLVRIVRIIRVVRFFRDLRLMVMGVCCTMKPFLWALLLLALIMYVFAVIFLQVVSGELAKPVYNSALDRVYYSSIWRVMYTLYMCITGGISWEEVAEPLVEVNPVLAPVFTIYIAFSVFCVLNIVTGIFVERSSAMALEDEENMLIAEVESRKKWMMDIEAIFRQADKHDSGEIRWEEFRELLNDFRVQTCMKKLGVDMQRMRPAQLWDTLDFDNSGALEISEFSNGLQQIHGNARSIDLCRIRREQKVASQKIAKLTQVCEKRVDKIERFAHGVADDVAKQLQKVANPNATIRSEAEAKPSRTVCAI